MVLGRLLAAVLVSLLCSATAFAQRATTREALERLEEVIEMRIDDGSLRKAELLPALLVSTEVRYEESQGWFSSAALSALINSLGPQDLRACEACMAPRVFAEEGRLERSAGPISLQEIRRLDDTARGKSKPALTAIWIDEHASGVSIKIVELATARVVFAQNVDPTLKEDADSEDMMRLSEELERRQRGDSLTQVFVDVAIFPNPQVSMDWTDQWGAENKNMTGVSLSLFNPVLGLGAVYHRVIGVFRIGSWPIAPTIGFKLLVSLPTAIVQSVTGDGSADLLDPLVNGQLIARVPIGRSNYGLSLTAGWGVGGGVAKAPTFGIGFSLLNISLLPVIP